VAYLMTLWIAQNKLRGTTEWFVNYELKRIWKEAVQARFDSLSRQIVWRGWEKPHKSSGNIMSFWVEIWSRGFPNGKQESYPLDLDVKDNKTKFLYIFSLVRNYIFFTFKAYGFVLGAGIAQSV
jgi:hypothetical protein